MEHAGIAKISFDGASEKLELKGELMMTSAGGSDTRLVLMSGNTLDTERGTSLTTALSDLVLAARSDILLNDVALESTREVAIRSLRNIELAQVQLRADSIVRMKASRDLNVNGLELSQKLPSLILEATTIRLRNVDFPSSAAVQLNSLKGPIDGKYPNFGTQVPISSQMGQVNFLEILRSGEICKDRMTFDNSEVTFRLAKYPSPDLIPSIDEVSFPQLSLGFIRRYINGSPLPFGSNETECIGFTRLFNLPLEPGSSGNRGTGRAG